MLVVDSSQLPGSDQEKKHKTGEEKKGEKRRVHEAKKVVAENLKNTWEQFKMA